MTQRSILVTATVTMLILSACSGSSGARSAIDPNPAPTTSPAATANATNQTQDTAATTPDGAPAAGADVRSAGDENIVVPMGWEYELMTSYQPSNVVVAAGASREFVVSASDVGSSAGVWSVEIDSRLRDGVSVSGAPSALDFTSQSELFFSVTVTVPEGSAEGSVGSFDILMDPPEGGLTSGLAASSFGVNVVAAGTPVGPFAERDFVAGLVDGVTFDPLANDSPGDAALDRTTLRITDHTGPGDITINSDGNVVYESAGRITTDTAIYEVCDTEQRCATSVIHLWAG